MSLYNVGDDQAKRKLDHAEDEGFEVDEETEISSAPFRVHDLEETVLEGN